MSTDEAKNAAKPEPFPVMGCGILLGVLVIFLDFFDVPFFDGRGPGSAVIIFGLGIFALVIEGLQTGALPMARGFIIRDLIAPIFWISVALYALAGTTMVVVGCLMVFGIIER